MPFTLGDHQRTRPKVVGLSLYNMRARSAQHDEIGGGNCRSRAIERPGRIVALGRSPDFAPSRIGRQEIARCEKRSGLGDIVHEYEASGCHVFCGAADVEQGKLIVMIAVDEYHARTNALTLHLHIEIHRTHRMDADMLKQFSWPMGNRRSNIIASKRIDGMQKAMTICMERAAKRFCCSGLIASDFKYMVGTQVANNGIQQSLRLPGDKGALGGRVVFEKLRCRFELAGGQNI